MLNEGGPRKQKADEVKSGARCTLHFSGQF